VSSSICTPIPLYHSSCPSCSLSPISDIKSNLRILWIAQLTTTTTTTTTTTSLNRISTSSPDVDPTESTNARRTKMAIRLKGYRFQQSCTTRCCNYCYSNNRNPRIEYHVRLSRSGKHDVVRKNMIESVKYIRFSKEQQHAAKTTTPKLALYYKLMREKEREILSQPGPIQRHDQLSQVHNLKKSDAQHVDNNRLHTLWGSPDTIRSKQFW